MYYLVKIHLLICDLFNDALSSSDYTASNAWIANKRKISEHAISVQRFETRTSRTRILPMFNEVLVSDINANVT
jgi:hypothetical protein